MRIYISKNNQQFGHFSENQVLEMLKNGQFSPNDLGIVQGETNWQALRNIFPQSGQISPMQNSQNLALPVSLGRNPKMNKRLLIGLYFGSLFLVLIGIFSLVLGLMAAADNILRGIISITFVIAGLAYFQFVIVHTVLMFYILYKMWSSIQDGISTSTGKAIGFLFIPVFSIYWIFKAWGGFPTEYNNFVDRFRLKVPILDSSIYVIFPIAILLTGLLIFPILFLPFIFLTVISQTCDAVNRLSQAIENKRAGNEQEFIFDVDKSRFFSPKMKLAAFGFSGALLIALLLFSGFVIWNKNPSPSKNEIPDMVGNFSKTKNLQSKGTFFGGRRDFTAMYELTDNQTKKAVVYDIRDAVLDYERKLSSSSKVNGNITNSNGNQVGEFQINDGLLEIYNEGKRIMIWDLNLKTPTYALPYNSERLEGKITSLTNTEMLDFAKNLPINSQVKFSDVDLSKISTSPTSSTTTSSSDNIKGGRNVTVNDKADFTFTAEEFFALTKKKNNPTYIGKVIDISGRAYLLSSLKLKANIYDYVETNMSTGQSTANIKEDERLKLKCVAVEKYSELALGNCIILESKGIISINDTPDFTTTAAEYYKTSLSVSNKYRNKIVDVTGKVKVISGKGDQLHANEYSWVSCYPDADAEDQFKNLTEGAEVKFRGLGDISGLKHCIVVSQ